MFHVISLDGNIGSGKSTLLQHMKTQFESSHNIIFLQEPVDHWIEIKDEKGETILEKFYADQEKYGFSFQIMAYISRLKILRDAVKSAPKDKKTIIVTERSLFTDRFVFAKMLYDTGKIESVCYQIYLKWFDEFADDYPLHKVIYIQTDPEVCSMRIAKRLREGEENIPLEYLRNCAKYHDVMLDINNPECVCRNQLVLNGNLDIIENPNDLQNWLREIQDFL